MVTRERGDSTGQRAPTRSRGRGLEAAPARLRRTDGYIGGPRPPLTILTPRLGGDTASSPLRYTADGCGPPP